MNHVSSLIHFSCQVLKATLTGEAVDLTVIIKAQGDVTEYVIIS